jgi:sigma-B regulation protein RsbU (phosphoserine phosphatase)
LTGKRKRGFRQRGIAFKLSAFLIIGSTLILTLVVGYTYLVSRKIVLEDEEEKSRNLGWATTNRISEVLSSVGKTVENLAYFLGETTLTKEELLSVLRRLVEQNPDIYGSAAAFEPYAFDRRSRDFAPYFFKNRGGVTSRFLGGAGYDYFSWDWYQIPREIRRPVWSEPYYDEGGGNILMSTFAVPFFKNIGGKEQLTGILTADISLAWLQDIVASIKIYKTGYGFLLSRHGTVVTHPVKALIMNETIFSLAEARRDTRLREIGRDMIKGNAGFIPFIDPTTEKDGWMAYAPVPSNGWSLGMIIPKNELMANIVRLNRTVAFLGIAGFLLLLAGIVAIAGSITRPLRTLAEATRTIAAGNLDGDFPSVTSRDEVGRLARSFEAMRISLRQYMTDLTAATAAREKIESELKIAAAIQMSLIPKTFPPFPGRNEFEIQAAIKPAREVGGDFYDFFFIDEEHLLFSIADVSGKGIPAALFMAVTKTLLRSASGKDAGPGEILARVGEKLRDDNESCMFVTVFCGILDTTTGNVLYANAGHNLPLLSRRGENIAFLGQPDNMALGIQEPTSLKTGRMTLRPGDFLFLYTDGVTEAVDREERLFSEDRLKEDVTALRETSARQLIENMMKRIISFSGGAPQSDDMTMLVIRYNGPGTEREGKIFSGPDCGPSGTK